MRTLVTLVPAALAVLLLSTACAAQATIPTPTPTPTPTATPTVAAAQPITVHNASMSALTVTVAQYGGEAPPCGQNPGAAYGGPLQWEEQLAIGPRDRASTVHRIETGGVPTPDHWRLTATSDATGHEVWCRVVGAGAQALEAIGWEIEIPAVTGSVTPTPTPGAARPITVRNDSAVEIVAAVAQYGGEAPPCGTDAGSGFGGPLEWEEQLEAAPGEEVPTAHVIDANPGGPPSLDHWRVTATIGEDGTTSNRPGCRPGHTNAFEQAQGPA